MLLEEEPARAKAWHALEEPGAGEREAGGRRLARVKEPTEARHLHSGPDNHLTPPGKAELGTSRSFQSFSLRSGATSPSLGLIMSAPHLLGHLG